MSARRTRGPATRRWRTAGGTELSPPRFVDELDFGFGWISSHKPELQMASHALLADAKVWLVDPNEGAGVEERVRTLGEPAGVLQLLDRHNRACAAFAERLDVPHYRVPLEPVGPFDTVAVVQRRRWQEVALWWPQRRVLVCADALGTIPHSFALAGERLGVHPLLRLTPPKQLARFEPEHVLCGHGAGVHERATEAVHEALANARRRIPRLALELPKALARR